MKSGKRLAIIVTAGVLAIGGSLAGIKIHQSRIYNRFYSLTMQAANTEGSGYKLDAREMAALYGDIGKRYNPSEEPEKSTIEEMRRYLDKKGIRTDDYGRKIIYSSSFTLPGSLTKKTRLLRVSFILVFFS